MSETFLWWDFNYPAKGGTQIVVESDHPDYKLLAVWDLPPNKFADSYIEKAEQLIANINAGRLSMKQAYEDTGVSNGEVQSVNHIEHVEPGYPVPPTSDGD